MLVTRFEDLDVWKGARLLVKEIYQFTFDKSFNQDFALRDQVRRSAISIMANIAEGFERKSNKEFIQFLRYSVASAAETKSHLYVALDLSYITQDQFDKSRNQIDMLSKQLKSFIKHLISAKS